MGKGGREKEKGEEDGGRKEEREGESRRGRRKERKEEIRGRTWGNLIMWQLKRFSSQIYFPDPSSSVTVFSNSLTDNKVS